ncbi:recombinase family protein [Cronobacter sakazakii]|uniref:recombinase family protein n=1 Tax=Cronobacter sakazakii TaxID=28141 RepID=UPI00029C3FDE|nr:recombinase family protein [Cronobacter sakazakii]CCK10892.1 putative resolvase [Cronobacter sakazakii 680]AKE93347.1 resolvase [Cronobacter sakazakii]EGT4269174.1 recombinase family protein [Cronobacter sakazakii]EGT4286290.1 recombinase family protein [Cronobacter sakazakii]EGT4294594.1 recombinase family protein [Cronobacter sakazakii]
MRAFIYCRVSTREQDTQNQVLAIERAGYTVPESRVISEDISGSVQAMQRPKFRAMVEHKLEAGDQLVVLKLDRLGRDNIDVQQTIDMLLERGVKVVSLDLPAHDLTSSEGTLIRHMFGAFAEFERNRIRERTLDGLEKAKVNGVKLGRKEATDTTQKVQELRSEGLSQSKVAKRLGVSVSTVKRHWNKGEG